MKGIDLLEFLQKLPKEELEKSNVYFSTSDNMENYYTANNVVFDKLGDIILEE